MLMRRLNLFFLLISILSLTACVEMFCIMAEGKIDQEIVFRFYQLDEMKPTEDSFSIKGINYISVDEYTHAKKWKKVWELTGESTDRLNHIIYGYSYPNLKEVMQAGVLKKDVKYRIFVSKPGVNGGGGFYFNREGNVVVINR